MMSDYSLNFVDLLNKSSLIDEKMMRYLCVKDVQKMSNSCQKMLPRPDNNNYQAMSTPKEAATPQCNVIPTQADTDDQLINLWIHGRSRHTQRAYIRDVSDFLKYINKDINSTKLMDLQNYSNYLYNKELSINSIKRILASIKSLFSFAHKIGYTKFDVGKPLRIPANRNTLAERILTEDEIHKIIDSVKNNRNRLIIKTLYYLGIRISELVSLTWKDIQFEKDNVVLNIWGKGDKANTLLIPDDLAEELLALISSNPIDSPVFKSRKGGHLNPDYVRRFLKDIAVKSIEKQATPHWYRHSHASHALDNGAPIHLVQKQLNHSSLVSTSRYLHSKIKDSSSNYLK